MLFIDQNKNSYESLQKNLMSKGPFFFAKLRSVDKEIQKLTSLITQSRVGVDPDRDDDFLQFNDQPYAEWLKDEFDLTSGTTNQVLLNIRVSLLKPIFAKEFSYIEALSKDENRTYVQRIKALDDLSQMILVNKMLPTIDELKQRPLITTHEIGVNSDSEEQQVVEARSNFFRVQNNLEDVLTDSTKAVSEKKELKKRGEINHRPATCRKLFFIFVERIKRWFIRFFMDFKINKRSYFYEIWSNKKN